jgi:hypothetical protein
VGGPHVGVGAWAACDRRISYLMLGMALFSADGAEEEAVKSHGRVL